MNGVHDGACQCGRVRFRAAGEPQFVSACHCRSCRRATGAAFSIWVGFLSANAEWTGDEASFYASSVGVRRGFCKSCGTPLSYESEKWPGETHFLIGAFEDPSPFAPRSDYMIEERLNFVRPVLEKQ